MKDQELTLSYSELQEYLDNPDSVLHKRITQAAEENAITKGGRVDSLGNEPLDFNYDDTQVDHNHRRGEEDWVDEIPKRFTLEEKIQMEYDPDPGIDWGN